jgi:SET domain
MEISFLRIAQWQRDDPVHNLIQTRGIGSSAADGDHDDDDDDEARIASCVDALHTMHPDAPKCKMRAALDIRLRRFDALNRIFGLDEHDLNGKKKNINSVSAAAMYSLVTSRAIELHSGLSGVIPFFDMINHSMSPNLHLDFDGTTFQLIATRDIEACEELFVCYHDPNREWDEDVSDIVLIL